MNYEFYADVFFLTNFYLDFLAIYAVSEVLGQKKKLLRYLIGCMACSLISCMLFLVIKTYSLYLLCMHFIVNPVMIIFCFFSTGKKVYVKAFCLMYFVTLLLGGSVEWLYINVMGEKWYELCLALTSVPIIIFVHILRWKRGLGKCLFYVWLGHKGKEVRVQAFYDTGNHLRDPYVRKPVHIVSKEIYEVLGGKEEFLCRLVPFSSVGQQNGMLETFTIEKMKIEWESAALEYNSVVLAVAEDSLFRNRNYQMILNGSVGEKIERKEEKICT